MCWIGFNSMFQQTSPSHRRQKILLDPRQRKSRDRLPGHEHHVHGLRQPMLMQSERFPQQPPHPAAHHRPAHLAADHHADARAGRRRQVLPVDDQTTTHSAASVATHPREIARLFDARLAPQAEANWRGVSHGRSNGRKTLAAHAAAICQRGFAALGGIAV
jgi:hypothetical protein